MNYIGGRAFEFRPSCGFFPPRLWLWDGTPCFENT